MFPGIVERAALKRANGQKQFGVDVEGFDGDGEPAIVVSAKCYRRVNGWDFRVWLKDFTDHLDGHWAGRRIKHFVLAVSHECNDDGMNEATRLLIQELRARGIAFHVWHAHKMTQSLRRRPDLIDRYFHHAWIEAISSRVEAAPGGTLQVPVLGGGQPSPAAGLLQQALAQMESVVAGPLNTAMSASLEAALKAMRAGQPSEIERWVEDARAQPTLWIALDPRTKAKSLRAIAMLRLRDGEVQAANELLDEADGVSPPVDASTRALLKRATDSAEDALSMLMEPLTPRERETQAAILIEAGRITDAESAIANATGEAISAELLRLRSIVGLLRNDMRPALADADSAVERSPGELAPLLTRATVRLFSALADGVRVQIGGAPEPINPGLLRDGKAPRAALSRAADEFEIAMQHAEGISRSDIEIWRLAALLLNPDRCEEGAVLARDLLDRPLPEPLAVAWAFHFGLIKRLGRLKKIYGRALREGRGTPAHLVVLAIICAETSHPQRGASQIRRHARRFPEAAEFLDAWRARFGDNKTKGVDDDFAKAVRSAKGTRNTRPLLALASADGAAVEVVLAAGEFLAQQKAWRDLVKLRSPLLKIASIRSVELTALACLRSEDPSECLAVLKEGARSFENGELPRNLIHLRIAANEDLGQHEPVIADLLSLRRDEDDAYAQARIMDAYVRIGDLDRFRQEAEKAIDRGSLEPRRALSVAYTLRASAPETARRALQLATRAPPPPETAGAIVSLAAELGLADLREDMMKVLMTDPQAGRFVTRFDRLEDVIALMDRRSRDHRERFGEWLSGRLPFAMATISSLPTYGRMFLAEPPYRHDDLGVVFPMLLLSGAERESAPPLDTDSLRLDLSAMLLAGRLGILPALEACFSLQVPPSASEALIELEPSFRAPSAEIVAAINEVLNERSSVRLVTSAPDATIALQGEVLSQEQISSLLRALLDRAFEAGHLKREQLDRAAVALQITNVEGADLGSGIVLDRAMLTRLAGAGVLEQVSRSTPSYLPTDEAQLLRSEIASAMEGGRLRNLVIELRRMLAQRLASGDWTTLSQASGLNPDHERSPAHVRCLIEVFTAQERSPGRLWIEDRALSHQRVSGVVHLPNVLDHLASRGVLGPARKGELIREARRLGYAFLPLDSDVFLVALEAAQIGKAGLIETPHLAELRRWIAREISLLTHLDLQHIVSESGRIVGEARRLLDTWGLARTLLLRIWQTPNTSVEVKQARSAWVWRSLRIDRMTGLPSDSTPETRRNFWVLQIGFLLDGPLLAILDRSPTTPDTWKEFVDWLMAVGVNGVQEADPVARDMVLTLLLGQLKRLFQLPDGIPAEEHQGAKRALGRVVRIFLDLLPDDWSSKLLEEEHIRDCVGTRETMTLNVGSEDRPDGLLARAAIAELAEGFRSAIGHSPDSVASAAVRLFDGEAATLEIDGSSEHPSATLIVDGHRITLDGVTTALLDPRREKRQVPPEEEADLLRPVGSASREELAATLDLEEPVSRFDGYQRLADHNLHRSLRRMGEASRTHSVVSLKDFNLPSAEAVAGYLRAPTAPQQKLAETILSGLRTELPDDEIAYRVAGLPLQLPSDLLVDRGTQLLTTERANADRISPHLALLDLQALAAVDADRTRIGAGISALLQVAKDQAAFFVAVLRHLAAAASRNKEWSALDATTRISFLWSYADLCVLNLAPPGCDFREVAAWLAARTHFPFVDRTSHSTAPDWYKMLTIGLTEKRLVAMLIGQGLRAGLAEKASADQIASLAAACGTLSEDAASWFPHLELVPPAPAAPSELWNAFDLLSADALGMWLGPEHPFGKRNDDDLATVLMDTMAASESAYLLAPLLSHLDVRRLKLPTAKRMREFLTNTTATESFEPNGGALQRLFSIEARLRAETADEAGMQSFLTSEAKRAAVFWGDFTVAHRDQGPASAALEMIMEAAAEFAFTLHKPMAEQFRAFAECGRAVADAWPRAAQSVLAVLDAAVGVGDTESAGALWPVLLDLRTRS